MFVVVICHVIISPKHKLVIQKFNVDLISVFLEASAVQVHVNNLSFADELFLFYFFIELSVTIQEDI